jgi:hypothetical protein
VRAWRHRDGGFVWQLFGRPRVETWKLRYQRLRDEKPSRTLQRLSEKATDHEDGMEPIETSPAWGHDEGVDELLGRDA